MQPTGNKRYFQLIPEKIFQNISGIEGSIEPKIKGYSREYLFEVVSIVASHTRKNGDPAQLQIVYIKKLVPQGDRYLHELINLQIIARSGNAIKGQSSYQYSFSPEYLSKLICVPLKNQSLLLRINKAHTEKNKAVSKAIRGLKDQVNYLKQLTMDNGFIDFINYTYAIEPNKYYSALASAVRIENKDFFYSIDNTSGRFHSNVTNMAKGLRQYLRINGEQLVNIDIKNSQPFISTLLLTNPGKVAIFTKNKAFALLLRTLKAPKKQDVSDYISLVVSGEFYEFLMGEFLKKGLVLSRSETKVQVLRILFARNRTPKDETHKKARQIFRDTFPTVHKIFSKIRGNDKGDNFTSFKRFAILLQRIESHLILKIILKRVYNELPGVIALTIHDSFLTVSGEHEMNIKSISKIICDEISVFVGFLPQIKVERYLEGE
jgi:hypothetical protein